MARANFGLGCFLGCAVSGLALAESRRLRPRVGRRRKQGETARRPPKHGDP